MFSLFHCLPAELLKPGFDVIQGFKTIHLGKRACIILEYILFFNSQLADSAGYIGNDQLDTDIASVIFITKSPFFSITIPTKAKDKFICLNMNYMLEYGGSL